MQQSKIFYPQHEPYPPRTIDRPDAQLNRPFPAFVLPENLAAVGVPNLFHPPNQEKEIFGTPPAGFHMAPCGCFFDPRIYRIEWATANFVQPSIYKLSGGPVPQNTYLLDSQKYVPYHPAYQPVAATNTSPYVLPFFKPEGPPPATAPHLTDPAGGLLGPSAHLSPFVDPPRLHPAEGLGQSDVHKPPATFPRPSLIQAAGAYESLEPGQDPSFQVFQSFSVEEDTELKEGPTGQDFTEKNTPVPKNHLDEGSTLGPPYVQATTEAETCPDVAAIVPEDQDESFDLPDKVLLEVAMKLFDCSPVNSDTETSLDGFSQRPQEESGLSGEDSSSDIRSLNLPDELLSFDYSVPEILSTVTSLDYLYNVNAFGEESPWESRPSSAQPPLKNPESHPEPEEKNTSKAPAGKPKQGLNPSSNGEGPEPELALHIG
ncbi:proline-rich protein 22 [Sceloporus undulatus]|uniref:proline-rich protein 22 n=1 Tax=Sceloporus undulatus TaxID=8520 RepID=UPI001C4D37BE|nr:proline-rich protein 22 [Sceloporus undulatus]